MIDWLLVYTDTFSNISAISWPPVLVMEEAEYPVRTTDHGQATAKLYHLRLRIECTLFWYLQSRARSNIKGIYPQTFPSIWVLNNLVVSEIPLYSTNYVNNRHRLIWTLCKNYIQIGWKSKTFKFWKFWLFGLFRSSLSRKP